MSEKISIIVAVYNVEKYLEECIYSLVTQRYRDIEILLVDDGSKDNSGAICEKYAECYPFIKVIHKENGGLSDARNAGIDNATGNYIGFVDSDDWIDPNMYESLIHAIKRDNTDIAICGYYRDYIGKQEKCSDCKEGVYSREEALCKLFMGNEIHDHSVTKLYRKELWDGISFPVGKLYEDIRTIYKVMNKASSISVIDECYYHYRQRKGSLIRSGFSEKKLEWIEAVDCIIKDKIAYNDNYRTLLLYRKAKDECKLLRELLLETPWKMTTRQENIARDLFADIKKYGKQLSKDRNCTQSMRLMGRCSKYGYRFTKIVFNNSIMKKYALGRVKYYQ